MREVGGFIVRFVAAIFVGFVVNVAVGFGFVRLGAVVFFVMRFVVSCVGFCVSEIRAAHGER